MNIGWITLHVSDMDRSLSFYHNFLRLPIVREFGGDEHKIVFLGEKEGSKLELLWNREGKITDPGKGVSIGFGVSHLDEWMDKLRNTLNTPIRGPFSPNPSIRFCFVSDPDGYQIQLYESKETLNP